MMGKYVVVVTGVKLACEGYCKGYDEEGMIPELFERMNEVEED